MTKIIKGKGFKGKRNNTFIPYLNPNPLLPINFPIIGSRSNAYDTARRESGYGKSRPYGVNEYQNIAYRREKPYKREGFTPEVEHTRDYAAKRLQRLNKAIVARNKASEIVNTKKIEQTLGPTGLLELPEDILKNVAQNIGYGVRPHQIKNSKAAKANMAYVRSFKHK